MHLERHQALKIRDCQFHLLLQHLFELARFLDFLRQETVNKLNGMSPFSSAPVNMIYKSNPISLARTLAS